MQCLSCRDEIGGSSYYSCSECGTILNGGCTKCEDGWTLVMGSCVCTWLSNGPYVTPYDPTTSDVSWIPWRNTPNHPEQWKVGKYVVVNGTHTKLDGSVVDYYGCVDCSDCHTRSYNYVTRECQDRGRSPVLSSRMLDRTCANCGACQGLSVDECPYDT